MRKILFLTILIIVLIVLFWIWDNTEPEEPVTVSNFDQCVEGGYPVMESYPRQCRTPDGQVFVEDIGNEIEKTDLIRINSPRPNMLIESPVEIMGEARGFWFFEGDFPVKLLDENDQEIAIGFVKTSANWMTQDFIPFEGILEFTIPATNRGVLILEKDNPSDLPENADELRIPVYFEK